MLEIWAGTGLLQLLREVLLYPELPNKQGNRHHIKKLSSLSVPLLSFWPGLWTQTCGFPNHRDHCWCTAMTKPPIRTFPKEYDFHTGSKLQQKERVVLLSV